MFCALIDSSFRRWFLFLLVLCRPRTWPTTHRTHTLLLIGEVCVRGILINSCDRRPHGVSAPCYPWVMTHRQSRNEGSEHEGFFGARLRGLRKDASLTQQELAQRAG